MLNPRPCRVGMTCRRNASPRMPAAEAEGRRQRVQRRHRGDRTVEAPAHLGHRLAQPLGAGRGDEQLVRHRHHGRCGETRRRRASAWRTARLGGVRRGSSSRVTRDRIEQPVAAAVVQVVLTERSERAARRTRPPLREPSERRSSWRTPPRRARPRGGLAAGAMSWTWSLRSHLPRRRASQPDSEPMLRHRIARGQYSI